jgi:hypothetical protein
MERLNWVQTNRQRCIPKETVISKSHVVPNAEYGALTILCTLLEKYGGNGHLTFRTVYMDGVGELCGTACCTQVQQLCIVLMAARHSVLMLMALSQLVYGPHTRMVVSSEADANMEASAGFHVTCPHVCTYVYVRVQTYVCHLVCTSPRIDVCT